MAKKKGKTVTFEGSLKKGVGASITEVSGKLGDFLTKNKLWKEQVLFKKFKKQGSKVKVTYEIGRMPV